MDTFVARFIQPSRLLFAMVVTLVVLVIAVGLAVALAAGVDSISVAGIDVTPFRWA